MMARVLAYTSTLQAPRRSSGLRPAARHVLVRASAEPSGEPHLGPEPSPRPGRPERASARQVLEEMQQMLADMQQMDPEVQQMRAVVQRLTAKVAGQEQEVSRLHKTLEAIDELSAQVEAGKLSAAATATSLARLSFAWWMQGRWRQADVYTGEELVEMASCAGWPASLDPILSKVLEGRCGYLAVRQLILAELTQLVPAVDALLPLFEPMPPAPDAAWWQAEQLCIVEVMEAVEQQRQAGGRTVPQRLMPYLPMLADYCAAAAEAAAFPEGGTRSLQQFLLAVREDACAPVVTLVAALAAGKLRTRIFVCGGPRLSVQGFSTSAEMMETKRPGPKELLNAQQRLQEAGRVVNWLVHVANPTLAAAAPLQLRGVLASQRMEEDWITWDEWQHHVDVGCPGLGAAAGVATMQLQLHPF